mmetsp:Transcript_22424/g.47366  ORF Transcript_22424/g.47366 Transcript_22424/m.47366 type:complete len:203 (-) Transcript_22424:2045-2653(-)
MFRPLQVQGIASAARQRTTACLVRCASARSLLHGVVRPLLLQSNERGKSSVLFFSRSLRIPVVSLVVSVGGTPRKRSERLHDRIHEKQKHFDRPSRSFGTATGRVRRSHPFWYGKRSCLHQETNGLCETRPPKRIQRCSSVFVRREQNILEHAGPVEAPVVVERIGFPRHSGVRELVHAVAAETPREGLTGRGGGTHRVAND